MFQNQLRQPDKSDPFEALGIDSESIENIPSHNPFDEFFSVDMSLDEIQVNPEQHYVHPHYVQSYTREDGTLSKGTGVTEMVTLKLICT